MTSESIMITEFLIKTQTEVKAEISKMYCNEKEKGEKAKALDCLGLAFESCDAVIENLSNFINKQ